MFQATRLAHRNFLCGHAPCSHAEHPATGAGMHEHHPYLISRLQIFFYFFFCFSDPLCLCAWERNLGLSPHSPCPCPCPEPLSLSIFGSFFYSVPLSDLHRRLQYCLSHLHSFFLYMLLKERPCSSYTSSHSIPRKPRFQCSEFWTPREPPLLLSCTPSARWTARGHALATSYGLFRSGPRSATVITVRAPRNGRAPQRRWSNRTPPLLYVLRCTPPGLLVRSPDMRIRTARLSLRYSVRSILY